MPVFENRVHVYTVTRRPLSELLACPGPIADQLGRSALRKEFSAGEMIFLQNSESEGLYLLLAGEFYRTADRRDRRLTLPALHTGDLAELAAVLGESGHTYSLLAAVPSACLLFPRPALMQAFGEYPPLRMRLLKEWVVRFRAPTGQLRFLAARGHAASWPEPCCTREGRIRIQVDQIQDRVGLRSMHGCSGSIPPVHD